MRRAVFDIECVGEDFAALDALSQHALTRNARTPEEAEAEKERLALYPVTGFIVGIGMLNPASGKGKMLYLVDRDHAVQSVRKDDTLYVPCTSEKALLEQFWQDIAAYDQVVSFNGRGFDAPYIIIRSMAQRVRPTVDLMPPRYNDPARTTHLDLADQLSFYGALRRFSLHLFTRALGIESPKSEEVDGLAVPRLFREKKYEQIAEYCMRDVRATAELLAIYEQYGRAPQRW